MGTSTRPEPEPEPEEALPRLLDPLTVGDTADDPDSALRDPAELTEFEPGPPGRAPPPELEELELDFDPLLDDDDTIFSRALLERDPPPPS